MIKGFLAQLVPLLVLSGANEPIRQTAYHRAAGRCHRHDPTGSVVRCFILFEDERAQEVSVRRSATRHSGHRTHSPETISNKHSAGSQTSLGVACGIGDQHAHQHSIPASVAGENVDGEELAAGS